MKVENLVLEIQYDKILAVPSDTGFRSLHYNLMQEYRFSRLDAATRGQEINIFLRTQFPHAKALIFNAPSESIMIRTLSVPSGDKKNFLPMLNYELDTVLPLPRQDTVYSFQIHESNALRTEAIAYICKKEVLYPFMLLFKKLNIHVKGIYVIPGVLFGLVPFSGASSGYLLHLSSTVSYLLAFHEGKPLDARVIPMGTDILTALLAAQWKKTFEESEDILRRLPSFQSAEKSSAFYKKNFDISKTQAKLIQKTAIEFSANLVDEIHKSKLLDNAQNIVSFESESENNLQNEMKKELPVFISSDNSSSLFIESLLAARMGVVLKKFPIEKTPVAIFKKTSLTFLAVSLSFQAQKGVNLLVDDLKKMVSHRKDKWLRVSLGIALGGLFLFFLSYGYDFYLDYRYVRKANQELTTIFNNQFGREPLTDIPLTTQAQELVKQERKRTELARLFFDRDTFVAYLSLVQKSLSSASGTQIEDIYYDMNSLKLNGTSPNFSMFNAFKDALKANNVFVDVDSSERLMPSRENKSLVKFEIKLGLKKDEADQ